MARIDIEAPGAAAQTPAAGPSWWPGTTTQIFIGLALGILIGATLPETGVAIKPIANPRKEREQHYYRPVHTGLIELGLKPHLMSEEVLVAMLEKVQRYAERIDRSRILPRVRWNPEVRAACAAG